MTMAQTNSRRTAGLPDPDYDNEMYRDVASKRLFAWIIDVILISVLVVVLSIFTFFTAFLFWPFFYALISFLYRWSTISLSSATPGMRIMAIGLRNRDGLHLTGSEAFFHTLGYFVSVAVFPLQLISIAMMLLNPRNQGLSDILLGTVALNRDVR